VIVFDVDGTLIGGEPADWASFDSAFEEVAGFALDRAFFESIDEVTAQAIVHQALADLDPREIRVKELSIQERYLKRLREAHERDPTSFPAVEGAAELLRHFRERGMPIAIATGDWRETISFKLGAAGIPVEGIPLVTSSEFYSRADIISAAIAIAGGKLNEAIYVGDGPWDLRACRKLGIPFVGVGHRVEKLRAAGAAHILAGLDPHGLLQIREAAMRPRA
jgi:phosphoglycolate phosphatase-like HAD superfamily hydrolase